MSVAHHYLAFHPLLKAILHWEESGWNLNVLSATLFAVKFWEKKSLDWKSLLQFTSLPFPCQEAPLWQHSWGDIAFIVPLPSVNAMPSQNGLTPHVLKDGGCFHFYPLVFKKREWRENCAADWHFKNLSAIADGLWRDMERWVSERRVAWNGLAVFVRCKSPHLTAFWVCEWKLQMLRAPPPNTDIW